MTLSYCSCFTAFLTTIIAVFFYSKGRKDGYKCGVIDGAHHVSQQIKDEYNLVKKGDK